jgi:hypothetical protein
MTNRIQNTSLYLKLTNGPLKLECYIALGWKSLQGTNAVAYLGHSQVLKKIKCCEYNPDGSNLQHFVTCELAK